jgi:hypothetical protein
MRKMNSNVRSQRSPQRLSLAAIFFCALLPSWASEGAAQKPEISVPPFQDKYSALVAKLESGQTDIDYRQFRESFLESRQFQVAGSRKSDLDLLRAALPKLIERSDYSGLIQAGKKILSIDYTDMRAHKVLQQTYKILRDESNWKKHHDIEFGLLRSIVKNGDGKSCKTAWPVIQLEEEYFVLEMLGAKLLKQSIESKGDLCDRMEVSTDEGKAVHYFGVAKVFEGREKRGSK